MFNMFRETEEGFGDGVKVRGMGNWCGWRDWCLWDSRRPPCHWLLNPVVFIEVQLYRRQQVSGTGDHICVMGHSHWMASVSLESITGSATGRDDGERGLGAFRGTDGSEGSKVGFRSVVEDWRPPGRWRVWTLGWGTLMQPAAVLWVTTAEVAVSP